jgi:hypothetical protein
MGGGDDWRDFDKAELDILEAIAEYGTYLLSSKSCILLQLFEEISKESPAEYRKWKMFTKIKIGNNRNIPLDEKMLLELIRAFKDERLKIKKYKRLEELLDDSKKLVPVLFSAKLRS